MAQEPRGRDYRRLLPWALAFSFLSIVVVVILFGLRSDEDLDRALAQLDWRFLPLALAMHVAAHVFWAARYALIANGFGLRMQGTTAWGIVTAGTFAGALTPGRIGGEGLKMALLMRRGLPAGRAGRLLVTDRAADLAFFMLMGVAAIALLPPLFGAQGAAARGFAVAGTAFLSLFLLLLLALFAWPARTAAALHRFTAWVLRLFRKAAPDLEARIERFLHDARAGIADLMGRRPGITVAALGLTLANWIVEYMVLWTLLRGFGFDIPYWMVFFVGIVLTLVSNIPITPGGSGVAEAAALALLLPLAPGLSPLFVVAWRGVTYYYDILVGGIVASLALPRRDPFMVPHDNV